MIHVFKRLLKCKVLFFSLPSCENGDDSYATIFHPVVNDSKVLVPSHIKRFSVKMFTFTKDEEVLKDEVRLVRSNEGRDGCTSPA